MLDELPHAVACVGGWHFAAVVADLLRVVAMLSAPDTQDRLDERPVRRRVDGCPVPLDAQHASLKATAAIAAHSEWELAVHHLICARHECALPGVESVEDAASG
jgi:hypothetical protein